jgi:hypothetical protein
MPMRRLAKWSGVMETPLAAAQRRRYEQDGLLFPLRVLTSEEAGAYARACADLEAHLGGKPRTIEVRQMHLHFPWAYRLATHPRILDVVENLLGPDLLVWATELFVKHPHDKAMAIGWHRDRPYMGLEGGRTTTAWVALADSTAANGCMRAVPGPERGEKPSLDELRAGDPRRPGLVDIVLQAGEMSLHDAEIPHGSGPNHSDQKRVGFVIRYITPETRARQGQPAVILARGHFAGDHFRLHAPPEETTSELALAGMRESAAEHLEAVLGNLRGART